MEKNPKISIILPIYNVESYLSRSLASTINQTLRDIEIICVDDGSKDGSAEIVRKYMKRDNRIILIQKENGGVASARNAGLDIAKGDRIMFLDPDDYLSLNACERIYEEHLNHGMDIITFSSTVFPDIPEPDEWVVYKLMSKDKIYKEFESKILFKEPCSTPFIWNKSFLRKFIEINHFRFPEDVHFGEDIIFLFEVIPMAKGMQFMEDNLHYYQCFRSESLMFKYGEDEVRKMTRHVKNISVILDYWKENGLIQKYGKQLFEWIMDFILPDLVELNPNNAVELARKTIEILSESGLILYEKKAKFRAKLQFRRLERIVNNKK